LFAENVAKGGACIVTRLPVMESVSDKHKVVNLQHFGSS